MSCEHDDTDQIPNGRACPGCGATWTGGAAPVRTYRVADESPERAAEWDAYEDDGRAWADLDRCPSVVLTWDQLAEANDAETMEEIGRLAVGERTVLGQCDPIQRVS